MRLTGGIKGAPSVDPFDRDAGTKFNGRNVEPDTELTITGAGRCRFRAVVTNPRNGRQWIDVVDSKGRVRSFELDRVETVHRVSKTRENA